MTDTVYGALNFAEDRSDGGEFSNYDPTLNRQNLRSVTVPIVNARTRQPFPRLEVEGLTLTPHPAGRADWDDRDWLDTDYVQSCLDLVQGLVGSDTALPVRKPIVRKANFLDFENVAPPAGFVHLDNSREQVAERVRNMAADSGLKIRRSRIYNVWKCTTPAPQDFPLTVADLGSVDESHHVPTRNVERENGKRHVNATIITLAEPGGAKWNYFPNMNPDESIVFAGADPDPQNPLGCPHSAFRDPSVVRPTVSRASVEFRVLAVWL